MWTDERGPSGCRKTIEDAVTASRGERKETGMRVGKVEEERSGLEVGGREGWGCREVQGQRAGVQPGWMVGAQRRRRDWEAEQQFHGPDATSLMSLA